MKLLNVSQEHTGIMTWAVQRVRTGRAPITLSFSIFLSVLLFPFHDVSLGKIT